MRKVLRRGFRLLGALGLAFLALMLLPMGIVGLVECSSPPLCSESSTGMASTSLLFGFLSLLGAGQLALKAFAGVRHKPEARARPRYALLRNLAEAALQAVFAIGGLRHHWHRRGDDAGTGRSHDQHRICRRAFRRNRDGARRCTPRVRLLHDRLEASAAHRVPLQEEEAAGCIEAPMVGPRGSNPGPMDQRTR